MKILLKTILRSLFLLIFVTTTASAYPFEATCESYCKGHEGVHAWYKVTSLEASCQCGDGDLFKISAQYQENSRSYLLLPFYESFRPHFYSRPIVFHKQPKIHHRKHHRKHHG